MGAALPEALPAYARFGLDLAGHVAHGPPPRCRRARTGTP